MRASTLQPSPRQTYKRKAKPDNNFALNKKAKLSSRTSESKSTVDRGYEDQPSPPKYMAPGPASDHIYLGEGRPRGPIIIKESFPLESCDNNEVTMLKTVHDGRPNCAFGVVKMYGHEVLPGTCYAVADVKHWPIFGDDVPAFLPERRSFQLLYLEEGTPLDENKGPKQLITAVFHAMIDMCLLPFRQCTR